MTISNHDFAAYVTQMRRQHQQLEDQLLRIEQKWSLLREHRAAADFTSQMREQLEGLRTELARHFAEEEEGGSPEEAVSLHPSLNRDVTRLEHEHPELLAELDRLIDRLRPTAQAPTLSAEGEYRRFADRLRRHEAAENRVLQQGFGVEVE
jgi:iron-sulfur cluster repair protein YtfE (RIC family)